MFVVHSTLTTIHLSYNERFTTRSLSLAEHRNMPMQDAMVLVAHNFESFKVEHRTKERDEIARKAAKMADDVLMREHEREGHPVSLLTPITLLSEGR